jgi:hypothetical protein
MQHCLMSGNPPLNYITTIAILENIVRTVVILLPNGKNVI